MIEIEKNVPMPELRSNARKYPWRDLKVGDSFFVPETPRSLIGTQASAAGNRLGFKFTVHKERGGVRVWRVA